MSTASDARAQLGMVTGQAVADTTRLVSSLQGPPAIVRDDLLMAVPQIVGFYADGSSALAADYYDDERDAARAPGRFSAEPVVQDRSAKLYNAIAWSTESLFDDEVEETVVQRLAPVVQLETARPFRDTVTTNRKRDTASVGWKRETSGFGCKFCRMLAEKGAVYRGNTVNFASHKNCLCIAVPVFRGTGEAAGPEASVMQYVASKKRRTAADRARLRKYLAGMDD